MLLRAKAPLRVSFAGGGTDVPPFPEPSQDGLGDGNPSASSSIQPVERISDYLAADTIWLDE